MSMQYWEIRGYGVEFGADNGTNTTADKIRKLLEFAPNFKLEVKQFFDEVEVDYNNATIDDFSDLDQDYCTGIPYVIAKVMNERYGNDFMSAGSDETGTLFLYMSACMPWEMTDFEKSLSQEQFEAMIKEKCKILYDENVTVGDVSIHDFG